MEGLSDRTCRRPARPTIGMKAEGLVGPVALGVDIHAMGRALGGLLGHGGSFHGRGSETQAAIAA